MSIQDFFSSEEKEQIVNAIKNAELQTSGEIRVHLEGTVNKDAFERAKEVFAELEMDKTKAKNGVLFYLATKSRQFVILGDEGINKVVPTDFWESTKDLVITAFKNGEFANGLVTGITEAGKQLKTYFTYKSDDRNELSDEISIGN